MDLKQISETISCNHIKFLNKKYDVCNNELYKKQMLCNDNYNNNNDYNKSRFGGLQSITVTKKSCDFKPSNTYDNYNNTNYDEYYKEQINNYKNKSLLNPIIFNENTRIKTVKEL